MGVILVTGIQAAGKSTVAQALAETFPRSVHVRGDAFRRMVVNGRCDMGPASPPQEAIEQLHLRYALAGQVADGYAAAGFTVVLQDIAIAEHLQHLVDAVRTRPLSLVVLAPRAEVVAARDAERRRVRGKVAYREGDEGVHALDRALREHTPRLGWWLDTSDLDVEQTVAAIRAHLDEAQIP